MAPHSRPPRKTGAATALREAEGAQPRGQFAGDLRVVVDPCGRARAEHARRGGVAVHPDRASDRDVAHVAFVPGADHGRVQTVVEPDHVRALRAEQPSDLLGDDRERVARVGARGDRRRHPPQRRLLGREPAQVALALTRLGHVAQVAAEQRRAGQVGAGDDQLDRKLAAVRAHALRLDRVAAERPVPRSHVPREPSAMRVAPGRRDDQLGQFAPDHLLGAVAERALGRAVDLDHVAVVVHRDDAVEGRVQDRALARVARAQVGLGPAALDELRDLRAEAVHRGQQARVGHERGSGREAHDADAGERERERGGRAGVCVGAPALPHAGRELARRRGVHRPGLGAVQLAVVAGQPQRAGAPELGADRGQQRRKRLGLALGRSEHAHGRVLGAEQVSCVWMGVRSQVARSAGGRSFSRSAAAGEGAGCLQHDGRTPRSACDRRSGSRRGGTRSGGCMARIVPHKSHTLK